ncbi:MAG: autotransporter-associated beta strand repeat protein [Phycisphaerales bacterium]|nr:autotransporter-associated beta strand repeat protein [Phycisphaerales bacterium]
MKSRVVALRPPVRRRANVIVVAGPAGRDRTGCSGCPRAVMAAVSVAAGMLIAAPAARAETYAWVGPTAGATSALPSGGSWTNAVGTNVWATGTAALSAAAPADTNTIPTGDVATVLSFGGSGSGSTAYTANDNINSDLTLNQLINNNSQNSGGAIAQVLGNTGAASTRLVFVANGATGPTVTNTGTANIGINIPVLMNTTLTGNGATASGLTQFNGVVSGTGNFVVAGTNSSSRFDLTNANTFTGGTTNDITNVTVTLTRGQVLAGRSGAAVVGGTIANGPFGTGTFLINTAAGATTLVRATTNGQFTLANPVTLGGDVTIGSNTAGTNPTTLTFTGPVTITGATRTLSIQGQYSTGSALNGDQTFAGAIGDGGSGLGLIKAGPAVLTMSGAASNTYTGTTTVNSGVLALGKTGGATAIAAGALNVGDNSTTGNTLSAKDELQYRQSNQLGDAVAVTLNGALLNLNNQSEGTAATAGAGPLTSQNASVVDFGSGSASVLHFADSSGRTWSGTLQVLRWAGDVGGGTGDQLLFGTSVAGLTTGQLSRVSFVDPVGLAAGTYAAQILPTGEVVPVPEPTTVGLAAATAAAGLFARRRRTAGR